MIGIIFKSSLAFIVSFLLLSFHINNKSVFAHLTEVVGPVGKDVQKSLTKSVKRSMSQSSDIRQLISIPASVYEECLLQV